MGDSITAFAYDRAQIHQPSFAAAINGTTSARRHLPAYSVRRSSCETPQKSAHRGRRCHILDELCAWDW